MAIKFVRAPSETPNISNVDDFCGLRYAYSNIDGFVKGKGNEIGYEVNGNVFTVKSGRIVLQGTESDIDSNGVNITVDSVSTKRYFTIYLKVNLATNSAQVLSAYDTANYPSIASGDNLTANTTGYAQLGLYQFEATSGIISNVEKIIKGIEFTSEQINDLKNGIIDGTIVAKNSTNATYAQYASADTSKGTIEERLTNLGFKSGSITWISGVTVGSDFYMVKQGKQVVIIFSLSGTNLSGYLGKLSEGFYPYQTEQINVCVGGRTGSGMSTVSGIAKATLTISTNGDVSIGPPSFSIQELFGPDRKTTTIDSISDIYKTQLGYTLQ